MSSTNKITTSKVSTSDQVTEEKRSSQALLGSVSFDEEDDEQSRKTRQLSQYSNSGIRTSTPGHSQAGSMDDLSAQSYLSGGASKTKSDINDSYDHNGLESLDLGMDPNLDTKSLASSLDPGDPGLDRRNDELDLLTPCIGGYSVPDLTSGLVNSHHKRYGASTTAKKQRPLRDYNPYPEPDPMNENPHTMSTTSKISAASKLSTTSKMSEDPMNEIPHTLSTASKISAASKLSTASKVSEDPMKKSPHTLSATSKMSAASKLSSTPKMSEDPMSITPHTLSTTSKMSAASKLSTASKMSEVPMNEIPHTLSTTSKMSASSKLSTASKMSEVPMNEIPQTLSTTSKMSAASKLSTISKMSEDPMNEIPHTLSTTSKKSEDQDLFSDRQMSSELVQESSKDFSTLQDDGETPALSSVHNPEDMYKMDREIGEMTYPNENIVYDPSEAEMAEFSPQDDGGTPAMSSVHNPEDMYKMDRGIGEMTYPNENIVYDPSEAEMAEFSPQSDSPNDPDVVIEEEVEVVEKTSHTSQEGELFTVMTSTTKGKVSEESVNTSQSGSSSTAELLQHINSDTIEFDASQFNAASTPKDGRSLNMGRMIYERKGSVQSQSSEEELSTYILTPPESELKISSDKIFTRASPRPSILKQRTSFPEIRSDHGKASQVSGASNSKVTFHDEIQTAYISHSEHSDTDHDVWKNGLGEQVSLDLPEFTNNCPSHLTAMSDQSPGQDLTRSNHVHSREDEVNLVSSSKLLQKITDREKSKKRLQYSSLPSYSPPTDDRQNLSSRSAPTVTETEVIEFIKQVINVTHSDSSIIDPFALVKGKAVTPSKLYQKRESRELAERRNSIQRDSVLSYTTPSKLLNAASQRDEYDDEDSNIHAEPDEVLLRVASTLIGSLDSGFGSENASVPSLKKLLQDVKLLEEKVPTVASAPVYISASGLLQKLLNRLDFQVKPSLTATYLEYLNNFEPEKLDNKNLETSESETSRNSSKQLFMNSPHSAPLVRLEQSVKNAEKQKAKKFRTEMNVRKDSDTDADLSSGHEHWNRIYSWLSLRGQTPGILTSREALNGSMSSCYPIDSSSVWSRTDSDGSFAFSSREGSKLSRLAQDQGQSDSNLSSGGKLAEKGTGMVAEVQPPVLNSERSRSYSFQTHNVPEYVQEKYLRSKRNATTRNQVLVNQAIVDMVNAVTLYENHMADRNSQNWKTKKEKEMHRRETGYLSKEKTKKMVPPQHDPPVPAPAPAPKPAPTPNLTPDSEATQPTPHHPPPEKAPPGTDVIIKDINERLLKMKAADDNRYLDIVTEPSVNLDFYNQYGTRATGAQVDPSLTVPGHNTKADMSKLSKMIDQYVYSNNITDQFDGTETKDKPPDLQAHDKHDRKAYDQNESGGYSVVHDYKCENFPLHLYYGASHSIPQKPGASLPASRVSASDPDKILGAKVRKSATGDGSKFLIEKEVLESQLRRLQVENSTMQTENKLLKEKYNRAQVRIAHLESQVRDTQREALNMNEEISGKMSQYKRNTRDRTEKDMYSYQERVAELTRELELLKTENASLQKQLTNSRRSADVMRSSNPSDRSRIIESFKVDIFSLKDEVKRAKQLLAECERSREQEASRRKEAASQVIKLTEMKALLQQEIEMSGGGTVAEKQVKSLERRLKITEERLHQERADRAGKLSDVEEKLINENARLQVLEKELKRQLSREREKHRSVDQKFKDLRDENERLRVQLADKPLVDSTNISNRQGQKKHQVDELRYLLDQIKHKDDLGPGQEHEIIWLLWQRKEALARQLKAWEIALDEVQVEHGDITQGLKIIRDERGMLEDRISRYKDTLEDVTKEKEGLETILKTKIKDLTSTAHHSEARVQNLEDLNTAITAENDSLRASLRMTSDSASTNYPKLHTSEARVEELRVKLMTTEADLEQKSRSVRLLETELESIKTRLSSKEGALEESLEEISRLQAGHMDGGDLLDRKQQQIDKLNAEVRGLQTEVKLWQDKVTSGNKERAQLEEQVEEIHLLKSKSKFTDESASHLAESEKLVLETELREKDNQVLKLSIKYNECENELQRTKRQYISAQHDVEKLELQLDQLQAQLRQKTRTLERMSSTESDRTAQLQALRENLTTANRELSEKSAQLRFRETEKEHMKARVTRLESGNADTAFDGLSQSEVQQRMLEMERENARRDLDRANIAMNMIIRENAEMMSRVRELRQELVKERTQLCQMTSDKVDVEQQLHICQEERDTLQTEKDRLKADLFKVSSDTNQSIYQLETNVHKSGSDYESQYHSLTPEGKKMAVELGTVHRLLEAREKEAILLKDTIDRQKDEIQSSNRRIEMLHEENVISRDNIDRLTNELSLKIKEHATASEANHSLASEKTRLEMEKLHLEKDVGQGGSEMERRLNELQELTRKLEKAEERFRDAERLLHQKETTLVAMETEMKHLNRNNNIMESEKSHLKSQVDKLSEESRSLRNINSTLEQRLSSEKSVVSEEKMSVRQLNQELVSTHRQVESVKHDHELALVNLETERRNIQNLESAIRQAEDKIYDLEEHVKNKELEADTLKNHLAENRNTIDQYKKDKQTLYQDVQDLCRKLADKDDIIARIQEKSNDTVDHLQKDFTTEKSYMTKEREKLDLDLAKAKEEIEELNERIKRKDLQIEAYVRTNHDLENERRIRQELEAQILKLEGDLNEARKTLDMLNMENKRKADDNKHAQDTVDKTQSQLSQLKDTFKTQREQLTREIHELRQTLSEENHKHEMEKNQLNELINKTQSKLHTTEISLLTVTENKASLDEGTKGLEKTLEVLRGQLHEEITARKLAEQRCDTYKSQAEDLRSKKSALDERNLELQAAYAKVEAEYSMEKDKYSRLKQEVSDERSTSSNAEAHAQVLHVQLTELQAEVSSLRSQLESQKQNLQGKNKRLTLDMKQQMENFDKERSKLVMQIQQISLDLENTREQVAAKNREQLKLQEEILSLEERYREANSGLKHAKEALRIEEQHREKIEFRNQELELKLRTKSDDDSDASRLDLTRAEISKMMADMKKKMENQLEQSKVAEKEMAAKHQRQMEENKRKIANLDSSLGQERSMHLITKTQLSSLEDDNQRLRTQLQVARKRTTPPEERSKSRMEEINEIIARSQTRAQQMLATGVYSDDPLRSSGRELLSPIPMMHFNSSGISDHNRSMASDDMSKDL